MNIFPPPSEKDPVYKAYFTQFRNIVKSIAGEATSELASNWMRAMIQKIPYWQHTNPAVMAVSVYLANKGKKIDRIEALDLIDKIPEPSTKKNKDLLLIDIGKYFTRLAPDIK